MSIIVLGADGVSQELRWTFKANDAQKPDEGEPVATLLASPATWESLLADQANIITELVTGRLRSVNRRDRHRLRSDEMHAISVLLGLGAVPITRGDDRDLTADPVAVAAAARSGD